MASTGTIRRRTRRGELVTLVISFEPNEPQRDITEDEYAAFLRQRTEDGGKLNIGPTARTEVVNGKERFCTYTIPMSNTTNGHSAETCPTCPRSETSDHTNNPTLQSEKLEPIYVASRASIPERGQMWRGFRDQGWPITSSWIDEDGEGQTGDFSELWERITNEIRAAGALVLYAEPNDFPLKGAFIEAGIALGMGKPVIVCLPDLGVLPRNYRPIGSWIAHPLVTRCDNINAAVRLAQRPALAMRSRAPVVAPQGDVVQVLTDLRGHFGPSNCWCDAEGDAPHLYCCTAASELVKRLSATPSPASSPVPPEQARICVKCKHQDRTDSRGHCIAVYRDAGGSLVYCDCNCEFPTATPTPVEQERSPEEVAHEDSYWDDPLRGTNKC